MKSHDKEKPNSHKLGLTFKSFWRGLFSLVELLIVIAIIALLTSILLPALSRAKDSARRIACANNVKQLHVLFSQYVLDYDGYMSPGRYGDFKPWCRSSMIHYLNNGRIWENKPYPILICPSSPAKGEEITTTCSSPLSYSYNARIGWYAGATPLKPIKAVNIISPAGTLLLVENRMYAWGTGYYSGTVTNRVNTNDSMNFNRHNGINQIIFNDGHLEGLTYTEACDRSGADRYTKGMWTLAPND